MPLDKISSVEVKKKDLGGMLKDKPVLDLIYRGGSSRRVASFSDAAEELNRWQKMIGEVVAGHCQVDVEDETEACPQCGAIDSIDKLLREGCSVCSWVSPRIKS